MSFLPFFDELLRDGKSPFTTQHFLKRISKRNYWVESDWNGCKDVTHAICIGIIRGVMGGTMQAQ